MRPPTRVNRDIRLDSHPTVTHDPKIVRQALACRILDDKACRILDDKLKFVRQLN